eukprot:scaffold951_cov431-Prasinococcus_capsulatus_cf.AAC.6
MMFARCGARLWARRGPKAPRSHAATTPPPPPPGRRRGRGRANGSPTRPPFGEADGLVFGRAPGKGCAALTPPLSPRRWAWLSRCACSEPATASSPPPHPLCVELARVWPESRVEGERCLGGVGRPCRGGSRENSGARMWSG